MEFDFNINTLFPETISLITREAVAGKSLNLQSKYQKALEVVIDELGRKSAQAQSLTAPITYLQKSLFNGHHLYILKDGQANNGIGSIIGFLKVGKKRLFLLDHHGNQNEMYPLCVLDFYVHESQQRQGCGLRLFNHMLHTECIKAVHVAIDRPSYKFLSFLKKHFKMWETIPQVNNFVIFEGFFANRTDIIRTSVTNDRLGNSRFRPLTRAVSDDIIRRNRETQIAQNQPSNNSRPISGFTVSPNEDFSFFVTRNNRRRRWNPDGTLSQHHRSTNSRSNFYSRFSHEQRSAPPSIKPPLAPVEIINHHVYSNKFNQDLKEEEPAEGKKIANGIVEHKPEINALPTAEAEGIQVHKPLTEVKNFEKSSSVVMQTQPVSMYKRPFDMLQELKAMDEKALQEAVANSSPFRRQRRWPHQNGRTAWNIFGVPVPSQWTLK